MMSIQKKKDGFIVPVIIPAPTYNVSTYVSGITATIAIPRIISGINLTKISNLSDIVSDPSGNLYATDENNHVVYKIDTNKNITILAGTGSQGSLLTTPTQRGQLNKPTGITINASGNNLYVCDTNNNCIRQIVISTGAISAYAGVSRTSHIDYDSTDVNRLSAKFVNPKAITIDASGNLYVTDGVEGNYLNYLRFIKTNGDVKTIKENTTTKLAIGAQVFGLAIDRSGVLFCTNWYGKNINKIVFNRTTNIGTSTNFAGTLNSPGHINGMPGVAKLNAPRNIIIKTDIDPAKNLLYVADADNSCIYMITNTGNVTTIVGNPPPLFDRGNLNGIGTAARFDNPTGLTLSSGDLYMIDNRNNVIRTVAASTGCPDTQYKNNGVCTNLPSNSSVNSDKTGFVCNIGYGQGTTSCTQCGAGFYNDVSGQACKPCSIPGATSTSPAGATSASQCTISACQAGYYLNGASCTPCSATGATSATSAAGSTSLSDCTAISCQANYYLNGTICSRCSPTGAISPAGSTSESACIVTSCQAGYYLNSGRCVRCTSVGAEDITSDPGATSASQCTVTSCQTGYYLNNGSCTACTSVGATTVTSPAGSTSLSECRATACEAGYYLDNGRCQSCMGPPIPFGVASATSPAGSTSSSQCRATACQAGYYLNNGRCRACPSIDGATSVTSSDGATSSSQCMATACEAGYYLNNGMCTRCSVSDATSVTSAAGSTNESDCEATLCRSGYYLNNKRCTACASREGVSELSSSGTDSSQCVASACQPGYGFSQGNCTQCGAGYFGPGGTSTCQECTPNLISEPGSSTCSQCTNTNLPPKSQGSTSGILSAIKRCNPNGTNVYSYNGPINPCTGQSFFDFDKKDCVNAFGVIVDGSSTDVCSSDTVYSQETNACVPVRVIVKPGNPQLTGTKGQPGSGDYENCQTVDQGDCTLRFKNGSIYTTTNPCIASGKIYDFSIKSCVSPTNPCCGFTNPALAAASGCLTNTNTVTTKNTAKCSGRVPNICCNNAYSGNTTCIKQGFWQKNIVFNANHRTACASGFRDYGNGIDTIHQKRARRKA